MLVADLFCGMGGLSCGFSSAGFMVKGYDILKNVPQIYKINGIGDGYNLDLSKKYVDCNPDIIIGGPPCKPWSTINLRNRLVNHEDYKLVSIFFKNVIEKRPRIFLMENVLPVKNDLIYNSWVEFLSIDYSIKNKIIAYDTFGASTRRRRLITMGFLGKEENHFFELLEKFKSKPRTVREAISPFLNMSKFEFSDHEWSEFQTISNYKEKYEKGKYGWYKLKMDEPAPSFGNIQKTYTLHPFAGENDFPLRVISVREAMSIMGFDNDFKFPESTKRTLKYQMIADVVSPIFSKKCALAIKEFLK